MKRVHIFFLFLTISVIGNSQNSYSQEESLESVKEYYFKLADFEEPKFYFYENTTYPEFGQYWRISSIPDSNILLSEAFGLDFEQIESFKERYDSTGAKVIEYIRIQNGDSIATRILASDVYRWNSEGEYAYSIKEIRDDVYNGFDKKRRFRAKAKMEILGEELEVIRFEDSYTYYFGFVSHVKQQTFYSKEFGLVRFLRFDERSKVNETYILKDILSVEEWMELQE